MQIFAEELGVDQACQGSSATPFQFFQAIADVFYHRFGVQLPNAQRYDLFLTNRVFNIVKAQTELGYAPKIPLRESVQKMVHWYQEDQKG